ncbi:hypothetical protein GCM10007940_38070 [Portibacter lacus]|uniref:Uncharacterized protein n=1 Tax=Portibacter lacus TaxID=1099794 RepID=A0AA37SUQ7_9BACT|nr:hypothetical protein GCM10007940_38070 [Portibacter lacus]
MKGANRVYAILFDRESNTIVDEVVFEEFDHHFDFIKLSTKNINLENLSVGLIYNGISRIKYDNSYSEFKISDEFVSGFIIYKIENYHVDILPKLGQNFSFSDRWSYNSDKVVLNITNIPHHYEPYNTHEFEYKDYEFRKNLMQRDTRIIDYNFSNDCMVDLLFYSNKMESFRHLLVPCYEFEAEGEVIKDFTDMDSTFSILKVNTELTSKDLDIRGSSEFGDKLKLREILNHEEPAKTFIFSDKYGISNIEVNARFEKEKFFDWENSMTKRVYLNKTLSLVESLTIPDFEFIDYELDEFDGSFSLRTEYEISNWRIRAELASPVKNAEGYHVLNSIVLFCGDLKKITIPPLNKSALFNLFGIDKILINRPTVIDLESYIDGWQVLFHQESNLLD